MVYVGPFSFCSFLLKFTIYIMYTDKCNNITKVNQTWFPWCPWVYLGVEHNNTPPG